MLEAKQSILINLPLEETFAYTTNLENMTCWSSAIVAIKQIPPGTIHAGATVRGTVKFLGRLLVIIFEVVEYEPERYMTLKSISGGAPCLFYYQFDPATDDSVTVCLRATLQITPGILDLPEQMVSNTIQRQLEYDLLTLKDLLEARASLRETAI